MLPYNKLKKKTKTNLSKIISPKAQSKASKEANHQRERWSEFNLMQTSVRTPPISVLTPLLSMSHNTLHCGKQGAAKKAQSRQEAKKLMLAVLIAKKIPKLFLGHFLNLYAKELTFK